MSVKIPKDKTRKGVRRWNSDGTEDWTQHDWFYKYVPQYIDGQPMYKYNNKKYNHHYSKTHDWKAWITFNKEKDADCIEIIDHHLPSLGSFVKFCLRAYGDYYHIFDDEENDTEIE